MLEPKQAKLLRQYLKMKLACDDVTWRGAAGVRRRAADLVRRTVRAGEAHSALLIGPRGSGKTTLISSVLAELEHELPLSEDAVVVKLNGLLHQDEKLALQAITAQMRLENVVGERVFGTVAENLSFLLSCLVSGEERRCKSMLFILEEFHLFCRGGTAQTLLYNLFDITHSKQAPLCVIGVTSRLDVMELLEKRVKSRFSHRHLFIFPNEDEDLPSPTRTPCEHFTRLFLDLLSLPHFSYKETKIDKLKRNDSELNGNGALRTPKSARKVVRVKGGKSRRSVLVEKADDMMAIEPSDDINCVEEYSRVLERCKVSVERFEKLDRDFVMEWNGHVKSLSEDEKFVDAIEKFTYYTVNEQIFRDVLFQLVARLSTRPFTPEDVSSAVDRSVCSERRALHLRSLSVLEFSLLIAMMHGADVLDGQPMNFEMVLHRYTKFAGANSSAQTVPRPVVLKALEHLEALELVTALGAEATSRGQREYRLLHLAVSAKDIHEAAAGFKALPTEISHWLNNSIC